MHAQNKYGGGIQAARFGGAGQPLTSAQQRMIMEMQMDMDSYGEDEYGDYDDEIDMNGVGLSGSDEVGGAIY